MFLRAAEVKAPYLLSDNISCTYKVVSPRQKGHSSLMKNHLLLDACGQRKGTRDIDIYAIIHLQNVDDALQYVI